ncbi:MAG: LPS-assembly protein LptD [Acidobacteria bacterium]|nr:LPS-assembly protein LptD [Acidobacteriota bacterium]
MSVALAAVWPASAAAQSMPACKTWSITPSPREAALAPGADPDKPRTLFAKAEAPEFVKLSCDNAQLFADEVELDRTTDVLRATGHVSFIDGAQRITAERLEFNTRTKLGTFWNAQGIMTVSGKADPRSILGTTEADAYFFGERIDKIGVDTYRLTNGRFTTCVQATPRWEFQSSTVELVKDRHAVMRNAVLRIKDVPILYLPWMYYPINKEDRATGFLMPSYGHSTLRGQTVSGAFFWAMNRSMDSTLHYDYSSKAGQGYGAEYRYVQAPGSTGSARVSVFNGKTGDKTALFTSRTFQVSTNVTQQLPGSLELRGVVDYTNDIRSQQLTQQSLYASTNSQRSAAANLRGSYRRLLGDAEVGFTDVFYSATSGSRLGSAPRIGLVLSQAPIGRTKIYVGATGDFTSLIRQDSITDPKTKRNVVRFDVNPVVRAPIGNMPYLALAVAAGFRFTRWSQQMVATGPAAGTQIPIGISRTLFDARMDITGPTITRIFDTSGSGYAKRWKHIVQPVLSVAKTTAFKDFAKVPRNDGIDLLFGGTTNLSYGIATRLLAKRTTVSGTTASQEIASIQLQQTYYSNAAASYYDTAYQSSIYASNTKLSPISMSIALQPTTAANLGVRIEYDTKYRAMRSISLSGGVTTKALTANATWFKQDILSTSPTGGTKKTAAYQSLTTSATMHTFDRRLSGTWAWSYDVQRKQQIQQLFTMSYMSQCCGIAAEYQIYNFGGLSIPGVTQDKRFNLSFSLAGIGTFTNLLGAFGR